jgi:hypothetical protein
VKIVASTCKVDGQNVALVAVQEQVLAGSEADRYVMHLQSAFPGAEVVLVAQSEGKARFYGRDDLVDALGEIDAAQIPWREMDVDL